MRITREKDKLLKLILLSINMIDTKKRSKIDADPIDDYLECVTYCSISSRADETDCQTICMERHLKSSYF